MNTFSLTICLDGGYLCEFTHNPETRQSAERWAREIAEVAGVHHVIINETLTFNAGVFRNAESGESEPKSKQPAKSLE